MLVELGCVSIRIIARKEGKKEGREGGRENRREGEREGRCEGGKEGEKKKGFWNSRAKMLKRSAFFESRQQCLAFSLL